MNTSADVNPPTVATSLNREREEIKNNRGRLVPYLTCRLHKSLTKTFSRTKLNVQMSRGTINPRLGGITFPLSFFDKVHFTLGDLVGPPVSATYMPPERGCPSGGEREKIIA